MSNRLAQSNSPYLLQHADNPVDWYPWGPQALQVARQEDKPIFLSIGYAACHWCHVMEHESFEDPRTAEFMNEHFVNIKVDREERPDVDSIYMDAVVALTGQGGWPTSVFLTPEGEPFFGGTYFPPERRHGMPSFLEVLQHVHSIWNEQRDRARQAGSDLVARLSQTAAPGTEGDWNPADLDRAAETLHSSFDWANGGWGGAPKFPQATAIEFLLIRFARHGDKLARDIAVRSLEAMAAGGIFDQLGGGFARYSVDSRWMIPHFEKMLYDNALLVPAYLRAWQITKRDNLLETAQATVDFLRRELRDPAGGFYSSIDADSEGEEGTFYVWTRDQIGRVLDDQELRDMFAAAYGVTEAGNFEGANVLHRAAEDGELAGRFDVDIGTVRTRLQAARDLLQGARGERVRPETDDKVLTAWNGFMLTALAEHARVTGSQESLMDAQSLAAFLLDEVHQGGRLLRSWRRGEAGIDAFLEDHAALGLGLLDLYAVDFQPRWFAAALAIAQEILASFRDPGDGFYDTRAGGEQLVRRPKSVQDSPTPSGSSMATRLLLRIDTLHGHETAWEAAEQALVGWADTAPRHPAAFAGWLIAADSSLERRLQLAIVGDPSQREFQELAQVARERYLPGLVMAGGLPSERDQPSLLEGRSLKEGLPTAFLCENFACQLPTNRPSELTDQLNEAL